VIVAFTREAEADLERIADWIARDSPRLAEDFVNELVGKCVSIGPNPEAFPVLPRHPDSGLRRRVHRNYLIFYRVLPARVDIVHILHGAMDYERLLFPDAS
jgi:toxin ParE1/3/4